MELSRLGSIFCGGSVEAVDKVVSNEADDAEEDAPMAVGIGLISWTNAVLPITQGMEISRLSGMWIDPGCPPQYNLGYS